MGAYTHTHTHIKARPLAYGSVRISKVQLCVCVCYSQAGFCVCTHSDLFERREEQLQELVCFIAACIIRLGCHVRCQDTHVYRRSNLDT